MENTSLRPLCDAEKDLIARCQKARKTIPGLAQLGGLNFWFHLVMGVIFTLAIIVLFFVKGGAAASPAAMYLLPFWTWVAICFALSRSLQFEHDAVQLICKWAAEREE